MFLFILTLITRKAQILLLANTSAFFSISCIASVVNLKMTVQHFKHLVMFGFKDTGSGRRPN